MSPLLARGHAVMHLTDCLRIDRSEPAHTLYMCDCHTYREPMMHPVSCCPTGSLDVEDTHLHLGK